MLETSTSNQKVFLQQAFYNCSVLTLFGLCFAGILSLYNLLYMFLMPILWAFLVGTVLFPVKRYISVGLKKSLENLNSPLLVAIFIFPFKVLRHLADLVYENALSFNAIYALLCYSFFKLAIDFDLFSLISSSFIHIYNFVEIFMDILLAKYTTAFLIIYTLAIFTWLYIQSQKENVEKKLFRILLSPSWILALVSCANLLGPLKVIAFSTAVILLSLISLGYLKISDNSGDRLTSSSSDNEHIPIIPQESEEINVDMGRFDIALSSDENIRVIIFLSTLAYIAKFNTFVLIGLIAALIFISLSIRIASTFVPYCRSLFNPSIIKITNVAVPGLMRNFFRLLFTSDKLFKDGLLHQVDLISSVLVLLMLTLGAISLILFTAFQFHEELSNIVKLVSTVISSNPEWLKYIKNATLDHFGTVDDCVDTAYQQGRTWIASNVRSLVDPKDVVRAEMLEDQVKLLIDNIYRLWEEKNKNITLERSLAANLNDLNTNTENNTNLITYLFVGTNLNLMKTEIVNVLKQNVSQIIAILQSIWHVLLANVSVLVTLLLLIFSFILNFGFELLNFVIEIIVFMTVVYYLLSNSNNGIWIPFQWIDRLFALIEMNHVEYRKKFVASIENAISGVFVLSAKMSTFYLFYTFLIHSLLNLSVVFIPSVIAAVLAAIPIVPTYSVSIFGFIELYLIRGDTLSSLILITLNIAPLFFADPAFYRELKTSHPYLTGLSVIGGIYWLGLQGAIIGPIILCSVIVLFDFAQNFEQMS